MPTGNYFLGSSRRALSSFTTLRTACRGRRELHTRGGGAEPLRRLRRSGDVILVLSRNSFMILVIDRNIPTLFASGQGVVPMGLGELTDNVPK